MNQSDDKIRDYYEKLRADGTELEGLVPVKARVAKSPRAVFSVRLSFSELSQISLAAKARGLTISDFMRQASLAAASGELDLVQGEHATALLAVREKARELYEAVEKL